MIREKVGEVNFGEFKTEFFVMEKTKKYIKEQGIALACLLPDGWSWYETDLFDALDDEHTGYANEKYGKEFEVIYYGIVENMDLIEGDFDDENAKLLETGFSEDLEGLDEDAKCVEDSMISLRSVKDPKWNFNVKFIVRMK